MTIILVCLTLLLASFSVHMVVIVLRQHRLIKQCKATLEASQQRIIEHMEERREWQREKDKLRLELKTAKAKKDRWGCEH